jgi:hypothetical protein
MAVSRKRKKNGVSFRISRPDAASLHVSRSLHFRRRGNGQVGVSIRHFHQEQQIGEPDDTSAVPLDLPLQNTNPSNPEPRFDEIQDDPSVSDAEEESDLV